MTKNKEEQYSQELERLRFFLKTIRDFQREIFSYEKIEDILESYLLTVMGALGISSGFTSLIDIKTNKVEVKSRGVDKRLKTIIHKHIPDIYQNYFLEHLISESDINFPVRLIPAKDLIDQAWCPSKIKLLVLWMVDKTDFGFSGLGSKIVGEDYNKEDFNFLLNTSDSLVFSILNAKKASFIKSLARDIQIKTDELETEKSHFQQMKNELDKKVFRLKSHQDLSHELIGLKDTEKLMDVFLMHLMGIFSVKDGFILFWDQNKNEASMAYRGIEKNGQEGLPEDAVKKLFNRLIKLAHKRGLKHQIVEIIPQEAMPINDIPNVTTTIGFLFVLNHSCFGLIGMGQTISGQDFSKKDNALMLSLIQSFMVHMENTQAFVIIQNLNQEMKNTIEDLTSCQHNIEILEKTKSKIKSAIQKERERAGRMSLADFMIILGFGLLLGLLYNFSSPEGVSIVPEKWMRPQAKYINVSNAKIKVNSGAILIDARPTEFFNQKHIPGAINLPPTLFDFVYSMKFGSIDPDRAIIVYGKNISRYYDEEVAHKLSLRGHTHVSVLDAGPLVWNESD